METLIQGGKYQILEVLEAEEGYRACLCIDVETNNHYKPMIFNTYQNDEDIRRFLPVFYSMKHCEQFPDLVCVMSGQHNITAVFEYHTGVKLKDFFKKVDAEDFELRSRYASMLLEECLILDTTADFIANACLEPDNIVLSEKSQAVMINHIIRPGQEILAGFKGKQLGALLECIFVKNRYVPERLWEYISELEQGRYENIVAAFSHWKEIQSQLLEEHGLLKKETLVMYFLRRLKRVLVKKKFY